MPRPQGEDFLYEEAFRRLAWFIQRLSAIAGSGQEPGGIGFMQGMQVLMKAARTIREEPSRWNG